MKHLPTNTAVKPLLTTMRKFIALVIMLAEGLSSYVLLASRQDILVPLAAAHLFVVALLFYQYWFKNN